MTDRGFTIVIIAAGVVILALTPTFVASPQQNVAVLERIAPRVERARTLPPETRDAILKVVERVRDAPVDRETEERRTIALARISHALQVKDASHGLATVGYGLD